MQSPIITINGGSSTIKFAVFSSSDSPQRTSSGSIQRIGMPGTILKIGDQSREIKADTHSDAAKHLIDFLQQRVGRQTIAGIGHRVVHGGIHLLEHQRITPGVIAELKSAEPLDLAHLPREIALIEAFGKAFADVPQVACFDTAFHRHLPRVAQLLPIPRKYSDGGVRRFGFHGLSFTYLMGELARIAKPQAAGKIVLAHLGSGASMAAVRGGEPIDTTMAFTPTAGLVMGTRPGDLDPGLLVYLSRIEKWTPDQMDDFLNSRCGLLGVSQTSADMQDLQKREANDPRAAEAVELFCYQARKWIGALAGALGGLDTLVFSGGIGEHAPEIRRRICEGLEFLGLRLDARLNSDAAPLISSPQSSVAVRVIPTDEEIVIARIVRELI